jgi:hypothetical protein
MGGGNAAVGGADDAGEEGMWTMIKNYDEEDDAEMDRATAYSKLAWAGVEPLGKEERPGLWYSAVGADVLEARPDEHPYSYYEELSRTSALDVATARQIEKDLPRTFADSHPQFSPKGYGARFQTQLCTRGCHWIPRVFA